MKPQKILITLIATFLSNLYSQAQKAVVALPEMNIVYIGLDNPVQIAIEGYSNNNLTVGCENCTIFRASNHYILKVTKPGKCKVIVTYKKKRSIISDTFLFRVKYVPRTESRFGELESGNADFQQLMNQNTVNCILPGFNYEGLNFKVIRYNFLLLSALGDTQSIVSNSDTIPIQAKKLIMAAHNGDKLLIDDINAVGPGGITKRLKPIAITIIKAQTLQIIHPDFYSYLDAKNHKIAFIHNANNTSNLFINNESLIFKGYAVQCHDTQFVVEIKKNRDKTLWEKHYYPSGKLKAEYNFERNDTIGTAINYYENGKVRSKGNLIVKNISIIEDCVEYDFEEEEVSAKKLLVDSFLFLKYAPIGEWTGYYENGKIALECSLDLYKYGVIPMTDSDPKFDIRNNNTKIKASIKEATESKRGYFKPKLIGSIKLFDREGKIIIEKILND